MTERINIAIPKNIKCEIDQFVDKEDDMNRSQFFVIAAYYYLQQIRKSQLKEKLAEGYSAMAEEIKELSRLTRNKQNKSLKYI